MRAAARWFHAARLMRVAARAGSWPYASASLALHNLGAGVHLRLAEMRLHGGHPVVHPEEIPQVATDASLPPLAWVARGTEPGWIVTVGPGVELSDHGIFEGVWTGAFGEFRPDLCSYAFGSGAVWHDANLVFVPPRHLEECLYVLHRASDNVTLVSNSLAFIFVEAGLTTADAFFSTVAARLKKHAFAQGKRGVDRIWPVVATDGEFTLYQCSYFNFSVDEQGRPHREWRPAEKEFDTYAEYVDLLTRTAAALFVNGGDHARRRPLAPVVAVSCGYDSPAVAAIAKDAGCTKALTLQTRVYGRDDSGTDVASSLGLSVKERAHVMGSIVHDLDLESGDHLLAEAAEFIATFGIGDDITFLPFENDLPSTMLVTGTWGDSIWAREADVSSGLPVRILFGKSLSEFRLRVGFAHLPLPFIGARFAEPARRLSLSEEMRPYCIGGDYDRPIARRIAEEAGVPRESFGIAKTATAPWLKNHGGLFSESMALVMARYRRRDHGRA